MGKKVSTDLNQSRLNLLEAMKLLDGTNAGSHGNVSCRTGKSEFLIKPSGVTYGLMTPDKFCRVRISSDENDLVLDVEGELKPSVDTVHHAALYLKHPWLNAICHTHSDNVVAHAICGESIECMCTEQADVFGGNIPCLPYADLDTWGREITLHQDGVPAVVLTRHGGLTFADDPIEAAKLVLRMEDCARKNILARTVHSALARPSNMNPTEIKKWHERYKNGYGQK